MKIQEYKLILMTIGLIGILVIATSFITAVSHIPYGEEKSELYLLGSQHEFGNYPFNITMGQVYQLYVGVGNRISSSQYYIIYIKIGNLADSLPNSSSRSPSLLPPLLEYRLILKNGFNSELPLNFSITNVIISSNQSVIRSIELNGINFNANKTVPITDSPFRSSFQLIIELWRYDAKSETIEYDNRFLNLQLNLENSL